MAVASGLEDLPALLRHPVKDRTDNRSTATRPRAGIGIL